MPYCRMDLKESLKLCGTPFRAWRSQSHTAHLLLTQCLPTASYARQLKPMLKSTEIYCTILSESTMELQLHLLPSWTSQAITPWPELPDASKNRNPLHLTSFASLSSTHQLRPSQFSASGMIAERPSRKKIVEWFSRQGEWYHHCDHRTHYWFCNIWGLSFRDEPTAHHRGVISCSAWDGPYRRSAIVSRRQHLAFIYPGSCQVYTSLWSTVHHWCRRWCIQKWTTEGKTRWFTAHGW